MRLIRMSPLCATLWAEYSGAPLQHWGRKLRCGVCAREGSDLSRSGSEPPMTSLRQQLRDNAVALISLVVALGSLAYNTWRNERTEHNRNVRTAAFELLTRLAELERVVFLAQYDRDVARGSSRNGWTYVLAIRDLSTVTPAPLPARAEELQRVWSG